jgi:hypothetical protein
MPARSRARHRSNPRPGPRGPSAPGQVITIMVPAAVNCGVFETPVAPAITGGAVTTGSPKDGIFSNASSTAEAMLLAAIRRRTVSTGRSDPARSNRARGVAHAPSRSGYVTEACYSYTQPRSPPRLCGQAPHGTFRPRLCGAAYPLTTMTPRCPTMRMCSQAIHWLASGSPSRKSKTKQEPRRPYTEDEAAKFLKAAPVRAALGLGLYAPS